jgi:hypothetical protein
MIYPFNLGEFGEIERNAGSIPALSRSSNMTFYIKGCGVTIQATEETAAGWISYILERGGVPVIARQEGL